MVFPIARYLVLKFYTFPFEHFWLLVITYEAMTWHVKKNHLHVVIKSWVNALSRAQRLLLLYFVCIGWLISQTHTHAKCLSSWFKFIFSRVSRPVSLMWTFSSPLDQRHENNEPRKAMGVPCFLPAFQNAVWVASCRLPWSFTSQRPWSLPWRSKFFRVRRGCV